MNVKLEDVAFQRSSIDDVTHILLRYVMHHIITKKKFLIISFDFWELIAEN